MRYFVPVIALFALLGAGAWAYRENYATRGAFEQSGELRAEIAEAQRRLAILKAEWAYLNRPDRLADLVEINFDRLELLAIQPDQMVWSRDLAGRIPDPGLLEPESPQDAPLGGNGNGNGAATAAVASAPEIRAGSGAVASDGDVSSGQGGETGGR